MYFKLKKIRNKIYFLKVKFWNIIKIKRDSMSLHRFSLKLFFVCLFVYIITLLFTIDIVHFTSVNPAHWAIVSSMLLDNCLVKFIRNESIKMITLYDKEIASIVEEFSYVWLTEIGYRMKILHRVLIQKYSTKDLPKFFAMIFNMEKITEAELKEIIN